MEDCKKHLNLAKKTLNALKEAFEGKGFTVVGDRGTKVVGQLAEADAARTNQHFGNHRSRYNYANANFPEEVNRAMRKLTEKRVLKTITRELSKLKEVLVVILYGSYARGDYGAKSDVGLFIFIIVDNTTDISKIEDVIIQLENQISKSIQPTIRKRKELKKMDFGLLQNIFQEGKILYLKEPLDIESVLLLEQKPFVLFTFELKNLSQKEKAKFNRRIYPHAIQGYKYPGLLQKIGGEKLSPGCLFVPYKEKEKMGKIFKDFKIEFREIKIWK